MTCRFSHLKFGDTVALREGRAICAICGSDVQPQVEKMRWKYVGHSGEVDLFQALSHGFCTSCGTRITGYSEVCGGMDVTEEIKANRYSFLESK